MLVLGVDPGLSGGASVVDVTTGRAPRLVDSTDIPVSGEAAKRRVDAPAFFRWLDQHDIGRCHFERAQAMPDQGASSGFHYGRAVGALEAIVQCCTIPLYFVEASGWKRYHDLLKAQKEDSRQRALVIFSGDNRGLFARKRDHNRAESALIALYGEAKLGAPAAIPTTQGTAPQLRLIS